jgi:5-methylcytosine-specific restriction endonuclease McrA
LSEISDPLRAAVVERADSMCEYCRLPTQGQVAWFPVDHIIPRSKGGKTELKNLALSCPRCNGHKWTHMTDTDPVTGDEIPLFNPRIQAWEDHFTWSPDTAHTIEGTTPCGRATIERLKMNHPQMVEIRNFLNDLTQD